MSEQLVVETKEELSNSDERLPYPNQPLTFSQIKPEDLPEGMSDWLDELEAKAESA